MELPAAAKLVGLVLVALGVILSTYGAYVYLSGPHDVGVVYLEATFKRADSHYELNTFSALPQEVVRVYGSPGNLPRVETDWKYGCFAGIYVLVTVDGTTLGPFCNEGLPVIGYIFGLPTFTGKLYVSPGVHSVGIRAFYGRTPIGSTSRQITVPTYDDVKEGRT